MYFIKPGGRQISGIGAGLALAAILIAFIMQYFFKLEPCPLCIVQRIVVVIIGLLFALDFIFHYRKKAGAVNSVFILLFCILGMLVAGRHVWLQHLPEDQIPACLPGFGYLIETFPLYEVAAKILRGTADCAEEGWTLFGLSIPAQVFLLFILFAVIAGIKLRLYYRNGIQAQA